MLGETSLAYVAAQQSEVRLATGDITGTLAVEITVLLRDLRHASALLIGKTATMRY